MLEMECLGESLRLLHEKAIYWAARRTLLIADAHFGKAAAFRHAGIPIPNGTTAADLARLTRLLTMTGAERLVVLGDFFHARTGREKGTMETIAAWRADHARLDILLISGNHDRRAGDPPPEWRIECSADPLVDGPFVYQHEPDEHAGGYVLAGHLHPAVSLRDPCGPSLRAACFWFGRHVAVLPAFGSFTGTYTVRPAPQDRVFAVGPDAVLEIPSRRSARV